MNDRILLRTALVTTIIGIISLYLISAFTSIDPSTIEEVNEKEDGEHMVLEGKITKLLDMDSFSLITLEQSGKKITVLLFIDDAPFLQIGQQVRVEGEISEYKGSLEIIADYIELL